MKWGFLGIALTVAACATFTTAASAAPSAVSVKHGFSCPADEPSCGVEVAGIAMSAAGDTTPHGITVDSDPVGIVIEDTAGAVAGSECSQLGPNRVRCPKQSNVACCPAGPFTLIDANITAGEATDTITLLDPHVIPFVDAAGGDDLIVGSANHEVVRGGPGNDRLVGNGNDTLYGGKGRDLVQGGPGDENLFGGGGPDRILGDLGADSIEGGAGRDVLVGGPGRDVLFGEGGIDLLNARDGARDGELNCGNPVDRKERVRRDRSDPRPFDC